MTLPLRLLNLRFIFFLLELSTSFCVSYKLWAATASEPAISIPFEALNLPTRIPDGLVGFSVRIARRTSSC